MKEIQSIKNATIKQVKKLEKRRTRDETQTYLIEGFHLFEEARKSKVKIKYVFMTQKAINRSTDLVGFANEIELFLVTEEVMNYLSHVPAPQGILAVVEMENPASEIVWNRPVLLLDEVQDPGNVGTMIRTADAAGFQGVILGMGCADIYNEKVLRSMQGSNYHLTICQKDLKEALAEMKNQKIPIYGTELNKAAIHYQNVPKQDVFALLMGNEGNGIKKELLELTTVNTYIPITGKAESLNVAIAAGILMFSFKK